MSSSDESQSDEIEEQVEDDSERTAIRAELSNLSFEELQKLKEKIGSKEYNEALFGPKTRVVPKKKTVFKRENKNRPREMSSKLPVPMIKNEIKIKKKEYRDPRFDPLCGEFNKKEFSENYNFLSKIRHNDIKAVRAELKATSDPEQEVKLRRLLQRLTNQKKADKKKQIDKIQQQKDRENIERNLSEGKPHRFMNKSERKVEALVKQYEDLKSEGTARVQRHLMRRQQKIKKKSYRAPTGVS